MASAPVAVKFNIATLERKASKEVMKAAREAARLVRDRIRAYAPEDEGTLARALGIHVRNRKYGVSAYVGVNKNIANDDGVFAVEYVKRKELGFYGLDALGRFVQKERSGLGFFRRGLQASRYSVRKTFGAMKL